MRLGVAPHWTDERLIELAVAAASGADVAVVVVGAADGTESEGYDKDTMALSGRQDELVRRVAAANRRTVVVVNAGMPVLMPWADDVAAIVQAWLPGQAAGEALAEVLSGGAEPGGRLPVTIPRAESDAPVLRAQPDNGALVYAEGLLAGYRGYDRRGTEPRFCFGHGLGYTDWVYESISVSAPATSVGEDVQVAVRVRNSGVRAGREVVQIYIEPPDDRAERPIRTLAGFASVRAEGGESVDARVTVPARAFARYDESRRQWITPPGVYTLRAGRSSRDLRLASTVVVG